ncbi:MAG: hypothetical protein P8Q54_16850, partial [Akkermansiaceae bacterium]|nr:hypothetical protein [Akkermansiaceae bacterium]
SIDRSCLPPLAAPADKADQFFSQHPIIYRPTHPKNRTHTGGVSPLLQRSIEGDSPLPFPDSGMLLSGNQGWSIRVLAFQGS